MTVNIFDARGMLRADLETIAADVPAEQRQAFDALVESVKAVETAEQRNKVADDKLVHAVRVQQAAVAAEPKWTFRDEHAAMVASERQR